MDQDCIKYAAWTLACTVKEATQPDPALSALYGAGAGALSGGLYSLLKRKDYEDESSVGRFAKNVLTGGLLGGGIGAGIGYLPKMTEGLNKEINPTAADVPNQPPPSKPVGTQVKEFVKDTTKELARDAAEISAPGLVSGAGMAAGGLAAGHVLDKGNSSGRLDRGLENVAKLKGKDYEAFLETLERLAPNHYADEANRYRMQRDTERTLASPALMGDPKQLEAHMARLDEAHSAATRSKLTDHLDKGLPVPEVYGPPRPPKGVLRAAAEVPFDVWDKAQRTRQHLALRRNIANRDTSAPAGGKSWARRMGVGGGLIGAVAPYTPDLYRLFTEE
jgi:hypothetical protein